MQASKANICATQFPGLSSKSVSYQVKDEYEPNLFKKKTNLKKSSVRFSRGGCGAICPGHGGGGVRGRGGGQAAHGILFPIPSSLEKNS